MPSTTPRQVTSHGSSPTPCICAARQAGQGAVGVVRMDGGERAAVSGVEGLQQVGRFAAAALHRRRCDRAGEPSRRDTYRWERPLPEGGLLSSLPSRLEPQRRGAVTRRAVAQRRSRASGLTRPLAEAIRGFDSGFGLGFVVGPLARSAAIWCKAFVFSSLPIRKVLVLPFREGR